MNSLECLTKLVTYLNKEISCLESLAHKEVKDSNLRRNLKARSLALSEVLEHIKSPVRLEPYLATYYAWMLNLTDYEEGADAEPLYIIVEDCDVDSLEEEVNQKMNLGYKPQGGVSMNFGTQKNAENFFWYAQAMVRNDV